MPLYEYQCASCGKKTEFIHSYYDAPPEKCPLCGGALRKLLSSPAFQFKGSGFYATDYKNLGEKDGDSSSKEKEGESSPKDKDGGSSSKEKEAGGDAKTEGGAEAKGNSAGDSSKEKKDSKNPKDSSKGKRDSGRGAVPDGAAAKTSTAPDFPSKKNIRRK